VKPRKIIKVGLDFDGVVTYNPMRVARVLVAYIKHRVLKIKKLGFFTPKNRWQNLIYEMAVVWPSIFPANGVRLLKKMAETKNYNFYLITGRYSLVENNTYTWLKNHGLDKTFKKIYIKRALLKVIENERFV
jgi:hypothetical protein